MIDLLSDPKYMQAIVGIIVLIHQNKVLQINNKELQIEKLPAVNLLISEMNKVKLKTMEVLAKLQELQAYLQFKSLHLQNQARMVSLGGS